MLLRVQNHNIRQNFPTKTIQQQNNSQRVMSYPADSFSFKALNLEEFKAPRAALLLKLDEQLKHYSNMSMPVINEKGTTLGDYSKFTPGVKRKSSVNSECTVRLYDDDDLGPIISIYNPENETRTVYTLFQDGNVFCKKIKGIGEDLQASYMLKDEEEGTSLLKEIKSLLANL